MGSTGLWEGLIGLPNPRPRRPFGDVGGGVLGTALNGDPPGGTGKGGSLGLVFFTTDLGVWEAGTVCRC